jgi:hypothetical protein
VGSRAAVVEEEDEMNYKTKAEVRVQVRRGTFGKTWRWAPLLGAVSLVLAVAGCNIAGQPCGWLNLSACDAESTTSGAGGDSCADMGGGGGMGGGFGGNSGLGGSGVGGSGVGVGGDPSTASAAVGAGGGDPKPPPPGPPGGAGGGGASPGGTYETEPAPCGGNVISHFRSSYFPFVTIVPDDGEGPSGGWQQWAGVLTLADDVTTVYSCHATIQVPLRVNGIGNITPIVAAIYSAIVANEAAGGLWPTPFPEGIFCSKFIPAMRKLFEVDYGALGARVTQ